MPDLPRRAVGGRRPCRPLNHDPRHNVVVPFIAVSHRNNRTWPDIAGAVRRSANREPDVTSMMEPGQDDRAVVNRSHDAANGVNGQGTGRCGVGRQACRNRLRTRLSEHTRGKPHEPYPREDVRPVLQIGHGSSVEARLPTPPGAMLPRGAFAASETRINFH